MADQRHHRQPTTGHAGASSSTSQPWPPVSAAADDDDDDSTYSTSTSTLSAEAATGSHVFTVTDYAGNKQLHAAGSSRHLPSKTFAAGGRCWRITYSPSGFPDDPADWVCFGLCLDEQPRPRRRGAAADPADATVRVRTTYSLLDLDLAAAAGGQPEPAPSSVIRSEGERTLPHMRSAMRYTKFMERRSFESRHVKENRFSVRCDVTVVTRTCRPAGVIPPPDLHRHLGALLASGVGADVTFEVGGEAFAAHRTVLAARSPPPVFKEELLGGLPPPHEEDDAAAATTHVRVHDIEPSVFRALLHFIYTDSLPDEINAGDDDDDETAMAWHLLVAAQRYGLERLEWICEDFLFSAFSPR